MSFIQSLQIILPRKTSHGDTNHSDMFHGGTKFVDNATDHIKIVFDDHFTTALNSEGAIDPDKWKSIAQCKSA